MKPKTLSAGVIVIRQAGGKYLFLLLRAYNYWDFPKGEVEAGEDPFQAARREVAEETGIEDLDFHWGKTFVETEPYGKGKVARYYLAETGQEDVVLLRSPELGRPEHHEYRWMSRKEAGEVLVPRVQRMLEWAETLICAEKKS